ncbi:diacylglycerol O-acyltransferase [Sinomonas cyclohexanicum]|uniref:Diacylglycerol O-acyltransferase n=1 Tax=Sinomonas cyclohexanicum TaxID=322009 RepID=A0ABN6FG94_SINCY|nr:wax ester/triacylglycerol synthase family O-acyltransferase [Corynebacterium cyclohexanicum]BCT75900.1 diacylglycerol O-acyltransferase [Corynebacterium cyclohexanicum]
MRDRLSALDSMFLAVESDTQSLHVGSVLILGGPEPGPAEFSDLVAARVAAVPILRRKVLRMPLELGRPIWVDDARFRGADHVHHVVLGTPGDARRLREAVSGIMGPRLDPDRPLWEVWQVGGLDNGRWAVLAKSHHTMIDGQSGIDLVQALLADGRDAPPLPPVVSDALPAPLRLQLFGDLLGWLARLPLRAVRLLGRFAASPSEALRRVKQIRFGLAQVVRPDLPPSVLSGPLGPRRSWGWADADLGAVARTAKEAGCTVNDVYLAALAGAYRRFLLDRGEPLAGTVLRAIVPVGHRTTASGGRRRNLASAMFVELPVDLPDARARLAAVTARTAVQKSRAVADATAAFVAAADHVPAPLLAWASRLYGRSRQGRVNVAATNIPGPPQTQFLGGRRVLDFIPYVPVALDVRATSAMVSYAGRLTVGITADADSLPDADRLVHAVGEEFRLLMGATG